MSYRKPLDIIKEVYSRRGNCDTRKFTLCHNCPIQTDCHNITFATTTLEVINGKLTTHTSLHDRIFDMASKYLAEHLKNSLESL
jgi:hypothetical protein